MAQVERGANRIYGTERDRPPLTKYGVGFGCSSTAGVSLILALVVLVAGDTLAQQSDTLASLSGVWTVGRYPLGIVLAVFAIALLFERRRAVRSRRRRWLAVGAALSVVLWCAFTAVLWLFVDVSENFGATYGPLAGTIAILLWTFFTAIAILLGLAFAAQLEAVRAGVKGTRVLRDQWEDDVLGADDPSAIEAPEQPPAGRAGRGAR